MLGLGFRHFPVALLQQREGLEDAHHRASKVMCEDGREAVQSHESLGLEARRLQLLSVRNVLAHQDQPENLPVDIHILGQRAADRDRRPIFAGENRFILDPLLLGPNLTYYLAEFLRILPKNFQGLSFDGLPAVTEGFPGASIEFLDLGIRIRRDDEGGRLLDNIVEMIPGLL